MSERAGNHPWGGVATVVLMLMSALPAHGQGYGGGTGEPNDPYLVYTSAHLNAISLQPHDWDKHFRLMADIDLSAYGGDRLKPIGVAWSTAFTGTFDGGGHTISGFTCRCHDEGEVGLFGWLRDPEAEVRNVGLIDPDLEVAGDAFAAGALVGYLEQGTVRDCYVEGGTVTAHLGYVGGLVGYNHGRMIACYSAGTVVGDSDVGGLVGGNYGRIDDCFSTGTVIGRGDVGGLAGYNACLITDCYSAASVEGEGNIGGFLGRTAGRGRSGGSAEYDCFWDMEASGQTRSAGGTGLTTAEMHDPNTFMRNGWDFVGLDDGPHDVWAQPLQGTGYPILHWQLPGDFALPPFSGGTGEPNDPYRIARPEEWNRIGHNPRLMGACFTLMNDVDLQGLQSFVIGSEHYPFTAVFEGHGHTVANFRYGPAQHNYVGLFGYVNAPNARICALGVIDPNIEIDWGYGVGSLVGCLGNGTVDACFARGGSISGGGIHVGGLVGRSYSAISNCYADGVRLTSRGYVGGLVGLAYEPGTVINCYSSSMVSGDGFLGGLVARGPSERVSASFWDILTSGQSTSAGGGTGMVTLQMRSSGPFLKAGWDFVDESDNGTVDIWWILEGQDYPMLWWERPSR